MHRQTYAQATTARILIGQEGGTTMLSGSNVMITDSWCGTCVALRPDLVLSLGGEEDSESEGDMRDPFYLTHIMLHHT